MKKLILSLLLTSSVQAQFVVIDLKAIQQALIQEQITRLLVRHAKNLNEIIGNAADVTDLAGLTTALNALGVPEIGKDLQKLAREFPEHIEEIHAAIAEALAVKLPDGGSVPRVIANYKPQAALYSASANYQAVQAAAIERKDAIQKGTGAALQQAAAATSLVEVQKAQAVIAAHNTALLGVQAERTMAMEQVLLQNLNNQTDREVTERARREESGADFQAAAKLFDRSTTLRPSRLVLPKP